MRPRLAPSAIPTIVAPHISVRAGAGISSRKTPSCCPRRKNASMADSSQSRVICPWHRSNSRSGKPTVHCAQDSLRSVCADHHEPALRPAWRIRSRLTYAYYGRSLWHFMVGQESLSVPVSGNFSTNDASIVVRAALAGTGIAMLPHFVADGAIESGRLIKLCLTPKWNLSGFSQLICHVSICHVHYVH